MNKKSLEDAIRDVHNKHKNKPSPLQFINPENPMPFVPQQTTPKTDARSALTGNFKPQSYTF